MKRIEPQLSRTERVYQAIVDAICEGQLLSGTHLVQDQLAERLGVSRQPIQQAMALLKSDGLVEDVGKRGLKVASLDLTLMRQHYDIRAALDGLAVQASAKRAAANPTIASELNRRGQDILTKGHATSQNGSVSEQIGLDIAFHKLFYDFSGNPLLERTAGSHWRFLRRAMGEILRLEEFPVEIWKQHSEILEAAVSGKGAAGAHLTHQHIDSVANVIEQAILKQKHLSDVVEA